MILSFINIRKVPWEKLKTSGFALGFHHLPRDIANVNEWKIMFVPYIVLELTCIAHLYCLSAVQAGIYSDAIECSRLRREGLRVRSSAGAKMISIFSPVKVFFLHFC